jgi:hypothetical protein
MSYIRLNLAIFKEKGLKMVNLGKLLKIARK